MSASSLPDFTIVKQIKPAASDKSGKWCRGDVTSGAKVFQPNDLLLNFHEKVLRDSTFHHRKTVFFDLSCMEFNNFFFQSLYAYNIDHPTLGVKGASIVTVDRYFKPPISQIAKVS